MRCYGCGNRVADGQDECPTCHVPLRALGSSTVNTPASVPVVAPGASDMVEATRERQAVAPLPTHGHTALQQAASMIASVATTAQSILAYVLPTKSTVHGRVIIAESAGAEDPDPDVCKVITRILWIIMLLPFIIVAAVVCLMFRGSSPLNLFAMLGVFRFLNPVARNTAQVPVRYFRIRENDTGSEVMVRMKGRLTHGNIGQEDLVTLSGRSRGGTLYAQEGTNHRTVSTIRLARSYSWVGLILTLLCFLAVVVTVHEPTAKAARTISSLGGAR